jgi:hypothetical protein
MEGRQKLYIDICREIMNGWRYYNGFTITSLTVSDFTNFRRFVLVAQDVHGEAGKVLEDVGQTVHIGESNWWNLSCSYTGVHKFSKSLGAVSN